MVMEISCEEVWREISNYREGEISREMRAMEELGFSRTAIPEKRFGRWLGLADSQSFRKIKGDTLRFGTPPESAAY